MGESYYVFPIWSELTIMEQCLLCYCRRWVKYETAMVLKREGYNRERLSMSLQYVIVS